MYVKPRFTRRSVARNAWRRLALSFVLGLTSLTTLMAVGNATPASASYVPSLSVSISISLVDPEDCSKHIFFVRVASDAGSPSGTAELVANGTVLQSAAVPAGGGLTLTVSSGALATGSNTVTARFVPNGNWAPASASIVVNNVQPANCSSAVNTGGGPLIDTGMAPDQAPAGFPWWIVEAAACGLIAAGGFVVTRARASER
jgi:hypothetical protein